MITQTLKSPTNHKVIVMIKPSKKLSYLKGMQKELDNFPLMLREQAQ